MSQQSYQYNQYIKSVRWQRKSQWVRSMTRPWWQSKSKPGRCVLFPWLKAQETHHLTYYFWLNWGWSSFGWELPIWHLVPLSKKAHHLVGKTILWQQPFRFFVNLYLRLAFAVIWTICQPYWAIPTWLISTVAAYQIYKYLLDLWLPAISAIASLAAQIL